MGVLDPKTILDTVGAYWKQRGIIMMISPILLAAAVTLLVLAPAAVSSLAAWLPYGIVVMAVGNVFAEWAFALKVQKEVRAEGARELEVHKQQLRDLYPLRTCAVLYHQYPTELIEKSGEWTVTARLTIRNISPWKISVDTSNLGIATYGSEFKTTTLEPPAGEYDLEPGKSKLVVVTAVSKSFGLAAETAEATKGKVYVPIELSHHIVVQKEGQSCDACALVDVPPRWTKVGVREEVPEMAT